MTLWWNERTEREKALLFVMGGVCTCFILYMALVRPVWDYRRESKGYFEEAMLLHADVSAAASELAAQSPGQSFPATRDDRPARVLASASARDLGLGVIRIQPLENNSVSFWLDGVDVATLFVWIVDLQTEHGIVVTRADIQRQPDGLSVQAQIVLRNAQ